MEGQLNLWGENERKENKREELKNISEPTVEVTDHNLLIKFLVTKDNGDQIEVKFSYDLNKGKNQKAKIEKSVKISFSRAFTSDASVEETSYIEPKYFGEVSKKAYAIFIERYNKYQEEQKRKSMQPELPLE